MSEGPLFPTQALTHEMDPINVFQFQSCLDLPFRGNWDPISDSTEKEAGGGHRVVCWDSPLPGSLPALLTSRWLWVSWLSVSE